MIFLYSAIKKTILWKALKAHLLKRIIYNIKNILPPFNAAKLSCLLLSSYLLVFSFNSHVLAQTVAPDIIHFSIPAQPVDKALIQLAQQADQTILFSYNLTKNFNSNAIDGYLSVSLALRSNST